MFFGVVDARRHLRPAREGADGRECLNQLGARALAVRHEARDVAPVDAAARGEQVVAPATGDAAQLHLARRGSRLRARLRGGQRQTRVTLDALARGVERVPPRLVELRPCRFERILDAAQRVDRRALHTLDALLVSPEPFEDSGLAFTPGGGATEQTRERGEGPCERGARTLEERRQRRRPVRVFGEEARHAEGRRRREVDDEEVAQEHHADGKGNAYASFKGGAREGERVFNACVRA